MSAPRDAAVTPSAELRKALLDLGQTVPPGGKIVMSPEWFSATIAAVGPRRSREWYEQFRDELVRGTETYSEALADEQANKAADYVRGVAARHGP